MCMLYDGVFVKSNCLNVPPPTTPTTISIFHFVHLSLHQLSFSHCHTFVIIRKNIYSWCQTNWTTFVWPCQPLPHPHNNYYWNHFGKIGLACNPLFIGFIYCNPHLQVMSKWPSAKCLIHEYKRCVSDHSICITHI